MVVLIGYVNMIVMVGCHSIGEVELTIPRSLVAPFQEEFPVGGELLDPVIPPIAYIDVTPGIQGHSHGIAELAVI